MFNYLLVDCQEIHKNINVLPTGNQYPQYPAMSSVIIVATPEAGSSFTATTANTIELTIGTITQWMSLFTACVAFAVVSLFHHYVHSRETCSSLHISKSFCHWIWVQDNPS